MTLIKIKEMCYMLVDITPVIDLMKKDKKYLELATEEAVRSDIDLYHHGAVLVNKKKIFSGPNERRTRIGGVNKHSTHAEINAIMPYLKSFNKGYNLRSDMELGSSDMYVARIHADGTYAISKPCKYCELDLIRYNISRVYYTDEVMGEEVLCKMILVK